MDWGDQGDSGLHQMNPQAVKEYSYQEDRNQKFRPNMEDTYSVKDSFGNDTSCALFAIFDGHGGRQVSDHCADRMHEELRREVTRTPGDLC